MRHIVVVVDLTVSRMGVALGLEIGHTRAVDPRMIEMEGCLGQCNGAAEEGVVDCTRNYLYRSVGRMLGAQILCIHLADYCAANNQSFLLANQTPLPNDHQTSLPDCPSVLPDSAAVYSATQYSSAADSASSHLQAIDPLMRLQYQMLRFHLHCFGCYDLTLSPGTDLPIPQDYLNPLDFVSSPRATAASQRYQNLSPHPRPTAPPCHRGTVCSLSHPHYSQSLPPYRPAAPAFHTDAQFPAASLAASGL